MRADHAVWVDFSAVKGKRLLIALSGGADSVALASLLAKAREALGLTLFAAHLDHGIRAESAGDAEWCRGLCEALSIPFFTARLDVPAECARTGEGLETAARRLRYQWLRALRRELGADCIALAHHMDDQAETVLMHLARGAGPEGICGMSALSGDLYRPLLGVRKRQLTAYLTHEGLSWQEDATNAVADNARNALRLHGIPELEKSYPQIVPAIARYAEAARIESDFVAEQAGAYLRERLRAGPYGRFLGLEPGLHPALLRRAVRSICGSELNQERLNAIVKLAEKKHGALEAPGGIRVERGRRGLYFLRGGADCMRETTLGLNGRTALDGICEIDARVTEPVPLRGDRLIQALDADALRGATLRTRRPGDRIRPLGCGEKLLSDYFTDRKVDRPLRNCVALLARDSRVLWVCGMDISEDAKLTPGTERAVRLACRYEYDLNTLL